MTTQLLTPAAEHDAPSPSRPPAAPRGFRPPSRRRARIALGVFVAAIAVAGNLLVYASLDHKAEVLQVVRDIPAGDLVSASDLRVVTVDVDATVPTVAPDAIGSVVNQYARVHIAAGTLMVGVLVQPSPLVTAGQGVVAVEIRPSHVPAGLRERSRALDRQRLEVEERERLLADEQYRWQAVRAALEKEVEGLEYRVLHERSGTREVQLLYALRRELLKLRNAVVPLVDICRRLEHAELLPIDAEMRSHFRDVTDHVQRVQEVIDALRKVLAFAFEASLMMGQAQQSAITRKLAAWAAILAVPTAVAGIYGMNFENMPELKWQYGYFTVLVLILALCGFLYYRFKRNGWL